MDVRGITQHDAPRRAGLSVSEIAEFLVNWNTVHVKRLLVTGIAIGD